MLKLDQDNCVWDFITNNENEEKNFNSSLIFFCLNLYNNFAIISLEISTILLTFLQKLLP